MNTAVVVGSRGQDGSILCEMLRRDGVRVVEVFRGGALLPGARDPVAFSILEEAKVCSLLERFAPESVYYLAAYHHSSETGRPADNLELFNRSHEVHVGGLLNFLEGIRRATPATSLVYAASSHVFGEPLDAVQNEQTPLSPICIYGITKVTGIHACRFYRKCHGQRVSVTVFFNHESPLRRGDFVSQKIIRAAIDIKKKRRQHLVLGDLSARVDWGFAPDYVDAMRRVAGLREGDDFIVASGEAHSVGEFVELTFTMAGLSWREHVKEDPALIQTHRPTLVGDSTKLRQRTGWRPTVSFEQMVAHLWSAAWSLEQNSTVTVGAANGGTPGGVK